LVIYVGFADGTIQVSTDGGVTFTSLAAQPFPESFITGLSVDPANAKAITASVSINDTRFSSDFPHVAQYSYATTPGSGTWTAISGNLPSSAVSRVVYDDGALIAATDAGVYGAGAVSGGTTSWSLVGTGLPKAQVQDLFVDPATGDLYAVTHGRGAWRLPVPAAPHITSAGNATFTKGVAGTFTVTATGNPAPTISESGALPGGVTFVGDVLSGTPTAVGIFPITFTAHNGMGPDASQNFTLTVAGFAITTTALPPGKRGTAYGPVQLNATGGLTPYRWKKTSALPKGVKLSSTGVLSGTPRTKLVAGSYPISVLVRDATKKVHQTATSTLTLTLS
jgi:hypothetical protein